MITKLANNSIKVFLSELGKKDIHVSMKDGDVTIKFPKGKIEETILNEIKNRKIEIKNFLSVNYIPVTGENPDGYVLSSSQRRIWVLSQFPGANAAYTISAVYQMQGELDIKKLEQAFDELIARYEILRTVIKINTDTDELRQFVKPVEDSKFKIKYEDVSSEKNQKTKLEEWIKNEQHTPYDFANGPLIRTTVVKLKSKQWILLFSMHHLISDGWSLSIFMDVLKKIYQRLLSGQGTETDLLNIQYKDYAAWQQYQLNEGIFLSQFLYWKNIFSGELPVLALSADKLRPPVKTFNGKTISRKIDEENVRQLKQLVKEENATLYMGLLAAVNVLMYKYTSQTDIIIGSPVAGRIHPSLENQIGVFINTLPLRFRFTGEANIREVVEIVKRVTLDGYKHQNYPFDELLEHLNLKRDLSRNPLYDVLVVLQGDNFGLSENYTKFGNLQVRRAQNMEAETSHLDLMFNFMDSEDGLILNLTYNTDLFEVITIQGIADHFERLIQAIINEKECPISELDYLSEDERKKLIIDFNKTKLAFPQKATVVDLFEKQVASSGKKIAVTIKDKHFSYSEINTRANKIAHYLREKYSIKPEDLIGIKLNRNEWLIPAIIGVLKSGGAYVPIDPQYPKERSDYILENSCCKLILDDQEIEKIKSIEQSLDKKNPKAVHSVDNLAYLIYTSGSTGKPNGVMIEHSNLSSFLHWCFKEFDQDAFDVVFATTSICFDLSVFEIFYTLCLGKRLRVLENALSVPECLANENRVLLNSVPSLVGTLLKIGLDLDHVSVLNMAGEPIPSNFTSMIDCDGIAVRNLYGPSEDTTYSTCAKLENNGKITIGKPIGNTQIYIVNENLQLQPIGVIGEICIAGEGLARGYFNNKELTESKFVPNPFVKGKRMYKTGDLGKWLEDGSIGFAGRKDSQVKIRGYRMELAEIEEVLSTHPKIKSAALKVFEDSENEKNLVAYFESKEELEKDEIKSFLLDKLPSFMIPEAFVSMEEMPLSPNGKIDKKRLPEPDETSRYNLVTYEAPRNILESRVMAIWKTILDKQVIGIKDDFFYLGGHSLKITRLRSEYHKNFNAKIELSKLFESPTIELHAQLIRTAEVDLYQGIERVKEADGYLISDSQKRIWILSQFENALVAYNIPGFFELNGVFNVEHLQEALRLVIQRHEILRTFFDNGNEDTIRQYVIEPENCKAELKYIDFRKQEDIESAIKTFVKNDSFQPFDLKKGPLLRTYLLHLKDELYLLYYNMHHIIGDDWSIAVFKKELLSFHHFVKNNQVPDLTQLPFQYKDFAAWRLVQLETGILDNQKNYWLDKLKGSLPYMELPGHRKRPKIRINKGHMLVTSLSPELTNNLNVFCKKQRGTLFSAVLTVWNILFHKYTTQRDVIIGTPVSGRDHAGLENQLGCYINTLVLRNEINPEASFKQQFRKIHTGTLSDFDHQQYPFDRLVDELKLERQDFSRNAVFDIVLNQINSVERAGPLLTDYKRDTDQILDQGECISKFDLELLFFEVDEIIHFQIIFNSIIYDSTVILNLIAHFKELLKNLLNESDTPIEKIHYLTATEQNELLSELPGKIASSSVNEKDTGKASLETLEKYWTRRLSGELSPMNLPGQKIRPKIKTSNGRKLETRISPLVSDTLKRFCSDMESSLFIGLLVVLKVLLNRYTGQSEVIVGTPVKGQDHSDFDNHDTVYLNTLVLRNEIDEHDNFISVYEKIRNNTITDFRHQLYPFDELVEQFKPIQDPGRNILFDVMVSLSSAKIKDQANLQEDSIIDQGEQSTTVDWEVVFREIDRGISFAIVFNTDTYDKEIVEQFMRHYNQMLFNLLDRPEDKVGQIKYMTPSEEHQLLLKSLENLNDEYPVDKSLVDLFKEQVEKQQGEIALIYQDRCYSYGELDQLSDELAVHLKEKHHIKADDLVGINLKRNEWLIICILGILKTGAAYVPIDPDYPEDRRKYIQSDSNCKVVIEEDEINRFLQIKQSYTGRYKVEKIHLQNLAYVIYTSGTTGNPKGVLIDHNNVIRLLFNKTALFDFHTKDVWTMFHSHCFDFSVWEIFGSLLNGCKLVLVEKEVLLDTGRFWELLEKEKVTILSQTPSAFNLLQLFDQESGRKLNIRNVIFGGEALRPANLKDWHSKYPLCKLINMYGITETTVHVTYKEITREDINNNASNVGIPLPTLGCLILDQHLQLVSNLIEGELYVVGEGLSRGYLNRPELTEERFIKKQLEGIGVMRMYKTGDRAKRLFEGDLEYMGRGDNQVKIRGYRIELGEIEKNLLKEDRIDVAVVLAIKSEEDSNELCTYYVSTTNITPSEIRAHLMELLPDYMVPSYYVQVDKIPLNANGKIDKRALPHPAAATVEDNRTYVEPRSGEEKILIEVLKGVLKKEKLGLQDEFFISGGDSIKSIQIVSRLKRYGFSLKLEEILRSTNFGELAQKLKRNDAVISQEKITGKTELTPVQRWFFNNSAIKELHHYNQSILLKSKNPIRLDVFEWCISCLIEHHDILRTVFKRKGGNWEQFIRGTESKYYALESYNLTDEAEPVQRMRELVGALSSSLDIEKGILFKIGHFKLKDGERLELIIHHLLIDGVSWRILLEDLSNLYVQNEHSNTFKLELPLKTDSYQKWALGLKNYVTEGSINSEITYWDRIHQVNIPIFSSIKFDSEYSFIYNESERITLNENVTKQLQGKVHHAFNTEINDVLLLCIGLALKQVFDVNKTVIKMEGHGREELFPIDVSRTIGWFTSIFPFILDVSRSDQWQENLIQIKEDRRKIPNKGVGYGILKYLGNYSSELQPSIEFNYLGDFGNKAGSDDSVFEYATEDVSSNGSPKNGNDTLMRITGMIAHNKLTLIINYAQSGLLKKDVRKFSEAFNLQLEYVVNELSKRNDHFLTPFDLTFKGLSLQELQLIQNKYQVEDIYQLSPLQEGMYFHWLTDRSSDKYFEQMAYRLKFKGFDASVFKLAYDQLIQRHTVLRTNFTNEYAGTPLQLVRKHASAEFNYSKVPHAAKRNGIENYLKEIRHQDLEQGFDLEESSLMRLHIIEIADDYFEFIWSHHHILMDGWCISIVISDFYQILTNLQNKVQVALPDPPRYAEYFNWLSKINQNESLNYWKDYLKGFSSVTQLPFKKNGVTDGTYLENREYIKIKNELFDKIVEFCSKEGITQNIFFQGVWGILLSKYSDCQDVVFATVVSGRPADIKGIEDIVGLFINTIPVRVKYKKNQSPLDLFRHLQEMAISGNHYHYNSLPEILSQNGLDANVFDHLFIFENYPVKEILQQKTRYLESDDSLKIEVEGLKTIERTNYDFNLILFSNEKEISIEIKYNYQKFDSDPIKLLLKQMCLLAEQLIA